jgi:hypothetical protein
MRLGGEANKVYCSAKGEKITDFVGLASCEPIGKWLREELIRDGRCDDDLGAGFFRWWVLECEALDAIDVRMLRSTSRAGLDQPTKVTMSNG